jgi:hypothetical protein
MRITLIGGVVVALIAQAAELPVREVILYKHGIGYFERSGQLGPGESARLDFKATEMNDVLKSLTLVEKGGGKISGLRYDSMDLVGTKLAEFPFKLGEAQPLSAVLDQLKGARLELQFGGQTVAGAIVSGRLVHGDEKRPEREVITLLLDSGELHTIDLNAASAVRFTDAKLQQQFRDYLQVLTAARSQDKRSVYIDSTDANAREVAATYTIPTAVWKSSYRLVLDASGSQLEGWAIVDNTTGEDWNKITLSLVSGRPISFISQLYPPRFVNRPTAELPEDRAVGPVLHEGAFASAQVAAGAALAMVPSAGLPPPPAPARMARRAYDTAEMAKSTTPVQSTVVNDAMAQAVGDLFEYRLSQPVTIRKNESAMLPFLQQKIDARKLLIYSDRSTGHPTNAAELTNATGKTLDGGPITVYDGGAYAGEALMETLKSGDKRLISYAVDLGTRISEAFGSKGEIVREFHAAHGILTTRVAAEETRTYTIRNVDQKAKTLIIEHPLRPGYTLLNQKPVEKTSTAYRFEVKLASAGAETFPVSEERVYEMSYQVANLNPDMLLVYVRNKNLSDAGRKQLEQILERKNALAQMDQQLKDVANRIQNLGNDEDRLRKNIESLGQVNGQQQMVQDYARKLAGLETQLASLRDRQAELEAKRAELDAEVNRLIGTLAF